MLCIFLLHVHYNYVSIHLACFQEGFISLLISAVSSAVNVVLSSVIVIKGMKARHIDVYVYFGDIFKSNDRDGSLCEKVQL